MNKFYGPDPRSDQPCDEAMCFGLGFALGILCGVLITIGVVMLIHAVSHAA